MNILIKTILKFCSTNHIFRYDMDFTVLLYRYCIFCFIIMQFSKRIDIECSIVKHESNDK